jgi:hypothetical protein
MAFSPFHWFRKHQKVFFAGLTVLCMLVFIGQAGVGADIFHTVLRWVGAGKSGGETLITLDGKKVTNQDIENVVRKRRMASEFLAEMAFRLHPRAMEELIKDKVATDAPGNPLSGLREILDRQRQRRQLFQFIRDPRQLDMFRSQIDEDLRRIEDISRRDKVRDDPDRLQTLQDVATLIGFDAWLMRRMVGLEDYYFGGSRRPDDVLDFMVWQHQADKLGITLTDADLARELKHEAAGQDVFDEKVKNLEKEKLILDSIRNREYGPQTSPRELVDALKEEFRVVMAQGLLLGAEGGARGYRRLLGASSVPAVGTPDQFLRYYRDQRTTLRVKMLTVPVSAFLDKVTGKPTKEELFNRYNQGREKEPSPISREPGFKEPRRIAVEYVSASPIDSFYQDVARTFTAPQTRVAQLVALGAVTPLAVVTAVAVDPDRVEYEEYLKDRPGWFEGAERPPQTGSLHTSSVLQPRVIASMFGSLSAPTQMGQNVFAGATALYATATATEVRESLKANLTMLLARANTYGSSFSDRGAGPLTSPLTALLLSWPAQPKPLPMATLKPQLQASLEKRIAERVLQDNLEKVRTELTKLKGKESTAIRAYIDKAVKDYHLTRQAMTKPLPFNVMVEDLKHKVDLNLKPLEEAYLDRMRPHQVEEFTASLFRGTGTYDAQSVPKNETGQRDFLFWRTEDKPARTREFDTVRGEVEAAWRFEEARKLARREAERLEAEINNNKWSAEDAARFLREQKLGDIFELDNVAQLVKPGREVMPMRAPDYEAYRVPASVVNQLTYPPRDMVKHLLELKRPGEATVIADMPAKNFFVAVLMDRSVPSLKKFEEMYKRSPADASLYRMFVESEREEYHKAVLHQLRADSGPLDKDGRFALPESYRKRIEGGGAEAE